MPINTDETKKQGCYVEILERLDDQLKAAYSLNHKRMLVLRMDIRQYDYSPANRQMTDFMRKLKRWLNEQYGMDKVGHLWVREQEKSKHQHYHLTLMMDGREVNYQSRVIRKIEQIAEGWGWPKPYTPKDCYVDVKTSEPLSYSWAFYRSSYLAKVRGKGYGGKLSKNYSASRLKPPCQ